MKERVRALLIVAVVVGVAYLILRARIELLPPKERDRLLRALNEVALSFLLVALGMIALGVAFGPALGVGVAVMAGVSARGIQVLFNELGGGSFPEVATDGGTGGGGGFWKDDSPLSGDGGGGGTGGGSGAPTDEEVPTVRLGLCYDPDPTVQLGPWPDCEVLNP